MSATDPSDEEAPEVELRDEVYENVGEAIPRLLDRQETVVGTFNRFRRDHLAGEQIQSTLNESLHQLDDGLPFLLYSIYVHDVEETLDILVSKGHLDSDRRAEAADLCRQLEWAAPAGEAYLQSQRGLNYWTSTAMGLAGTTKSGTVLFGQRANNGVDELWDVQAPLPEFGDLILREVVNLTSTLEQLPANADLSEAEVARLRQAVDGLSNQIDDLDRAVADLEQLHESSAPEDYDDLLG